MPPPLIEEWKRIRPLLAGADPAHQAQGVELLAALGEPWLYDQVLKELRLVPSGSARDLAWRGLLPDLALARLTTGRFLLGPAQQAAEELALRLIADAPPGSRFAAPLRAAPALRVGHRWPPAASRDLRPLRAFPALRWLEIAWTRALAGVEALDALPALSCLSLVGCEDLSGLEDLRLENVDRLLAAECGPLPVGAWPRLERLAITSADPPDLAALAALPGLRALRLSAPALRPTGALARLRALEELALHAWREPAEWSFLPRLPGLRRLALYAPAGLPAQIAGLDLEEVAITALPGQAPLDLGPLRGLARLRRLALDDVEHLPAARLDRPLPQVEALRLSGNQRQDPRPGRWGFLDGLPGLREVTLQRWIFAESPLWERLAALPALEALHLPGRPVAIALPPALAAKVRLPP